MEVAPRELRVTVLGSPAAVYAGTPLEFPTRKGLALLCYLAVRGQPEPRSSLAAMFWPATRNALANLRWELHNLRQLPGAEHWLISDSRTIRVQAVTDLDDVASGAGDHRLVIRLTESPLLDGLELPQAPAFDEWRADEQARLERLRLHALQERATELEADGRLSEARSMVQLLLEADPLDETTHRRAMRLAFRQGDLTAAAAHYADCRRMLAEELQLAPTPETLELAAAIEQAAHSGTALHGQRLPPGLLRPPLLVGRQREWDRLQAAWDQHQIIFISGRPGIGKTRLAQDFLRAQVGDDVAVLRGHAGDQETLFSSYARGWRGVFRNRPELLDELPGWVRHEVARFLPDLLPPPEAPPDEVRLARALVELYRQLLGRHGAAFVDDIQYFDPVSWRLGGLALQELSAELPQLQGRMVITFRTDEMPAGFLAGLNGLVAGGYASHVELAPLDEFALSQLLTGLGQAPDGAGRLHDLTGGNPFFVLELLRRVHTEPELELMAPANELLPESVHQAIQTRLGRLPETTRRLAAALAVLGDDATMERLAFVAGTDAEATRQGVDLLAAHQLVTGMRFTHDLLLEAVSRGLSHSQRNILQERTSRIVPASNAFSTPAG